MVTGLKETPIGTQTKLCTHCDQEKPLAEFYPARTRRGDQRQAWCKSCKRILAAERHRRQKHERAKDIPQKGLWFGQSTPGAPVPTHTDSMCSKSSGHSK